jgi:hypothetical protein
LRIKEQETCLTLQEHDDDDDDISRFKVLTALWFRFRRRGRRQEVT